jgi:hypothetical protein
MFRRLLRTSTTKHTTRRFTRSFSTKPTPKEERLIKEMETPSTKKTVEDIARAHSIVEKPGKLAFRFTKKGYIVGPNGLALNKVYTFWDNSKAENNRWQGGSKDYYSNSQSGLYIATPSTSGLPASGYFEMLKYFHEEKYFHDVRSKLKKPPGEEYTPEQRAIQRAYFIGLPSDTAVLRFVRKVSQRVVRIQDPVVQGYLDAELQPIRKLATEALLERLEQDPGLEIGLPNDVLMTLHAREDLTIFQLASLPWKTVPRVLGNTILEMGDTAIEFPATTDPGSVQKFSEGSYNQVGPVVPGGSISPMLELESVTIGGTSKDGRYSFETLPAKEGTPLNL